LIHEIVALLSINASMRRTIELYRDERAKPGIANDKINVLRLNAIEVCLPVRMTFVRFDQVS
jgi:hypothetical protein